MIKTEQTRWTADKGWEPTAPGTLGAGAHLVLLFGGISVLKERTHLNEVKQAYPEAHFLGCSTSGEIFGTSVLDDSLVVTAMQFESSYVRGVCLKLDGSSTGFEVGEKLAQQLDQTGLVHVFVLSDGLRINGSKLVAGLAKHLPEHVAITGGLAGDGARFQETFVLYDGEPEQDLVAVLGFYGDHLHVGYGSLGGWDSFGPERLITRSTGNVLYELDGTSALTLYKHYLGEHAAGLPATGLLFPLSLRAPGATSSVVRTILSINEEEQNMTFAGDLPMGMYARLMKANFDRLVDGAVGAAKVSISAPDSSAPDLAVLISCVGRKLVLNQRIEEEVEGVNEVLGENTVMSGFYSYGEISPFTPGAKCELHNQTMTITTFSER